MCSKQHYSSSMALSPNLTFKNCSQSLEGFEKIPEKYSLTNTQLQLLHFSLKFLACFIFAAKEEGQHQQEEVVLLPDVMWELYQLWQHLSTVKGQVAS